MKYRIVGWEEVVELSERLARMVGKSGYKPDTVIALTRGGWVPARIVSDILDIHNLYSIRVEYYSGDVRREHAVVSHSLPVNINGKRVLLVDDISHTGSSLEVACEHLLGKYKPAEFKIAALHAVEGTRMMPEYYVEFVPKSKPTWYIYPWHFWEDLRRIVKGILDEKGGLSVPELRKELLSRCRMDTSSVSDSRLMEIVSDVS